MRPEEQVAIRRLAVRFRALIVNCDKSRLQLHIQNFPNGSCGDACALLARYLADSGYAEFEYFCGKRRKSDRGELSFHSHGWLEKNALIVDITADQFPEIDQPVIVTRFSKWHRSFSGECKGIADYRERYAREKSVLARFDQAYRQIYSSDTDA